MSNSDDESEMIPRDPRKGRKKVFKENYNNNK